MALHRPSVISAVPIIGMSFRLAITGVALVSEISPRNAADRDYLLPLLDEFRKCFPTMNISYFVLDRGYDGEPIHRNLYEDYDIIPVIIRKEAAYPNGFAR